MARTFIRQTQMSGSFLSVDTMVEVDRQNSASAARNIQEELNILRSVVKENFGTADYWESVDPYNLSALGNQLDYIMSTSADFSGQVLMGQGLSVTGTGSFSSDISAVNGAFSGDLDAVNADLTGDLSAVNGVFSGDLDAVNATLTGDLSAVSGSFTGDLSAVNATLSGDLSAVNGVFSGDLDAVNADLTGDLSAVNATLSGDLSAVNGTFSGDLDAVNATLSGDLSAASGSFSGDLVVAGNFTVNGTQTIVNSTVVEIADIALLVASGSDDAAINAGGGAGIIVESADGNKSILWQNGDWNISDDLDITGGITATGDLMAASGSLSGDLDVAGLSDLANVEAVEIKIDGDVAQRLYIVGSNGEIKDEAKLIFNQTDMLVDGGMKLTGSLEAVNGDFSSEVSAATAELADMSITNGSIAADAALLIDAVGGELTFADVSSSIKLTSDGHGSLVGVAAGAASIYQAFNMIDAQLDALGAGHEKQVIAIEEPTHEVAATAFTLPADIQDDLNVYINGVLVHASGSAANAGAVLADAAKKTGEEKIIFAFELKAGDVITLEKF